MPETIKLLDPRNIDRNPENPRLVFDAKELQDLQDSIASQGILVPLTLYRDGDKYIILDGERRWRSALKLGMKTVPVILQPKPDKMTNIMMMFAIHNRRKEWDPLPTALKLQRLEELYRERYQRRPKERELAELASLTIGELRRLKKLLALPQKYIDLLLNELDKPRRKQQITPDHVIESTAAATRLITANVIERENHYLFVDALINKFRTEVIKNTVAPRKLAGLARAVERGEVTLPNARAVIHKLIHDPYYGIDQAYSDSIEEAEYQHKLEQAISRLAKRVKEHEVRGYTLAPQLRDELIALRDVIEQLLSD